MLDKLARLTVILTTVVLLCSGPAPAAFIPLTGDPIALDIIQQEGFFIVGDKHFTGFDFFAFGTGGAIAPSASDLYIQGGQDTVTGDYGLRFITSMNAGQNQMVNMNLSFRVTAITGIQFQPDEPPTLTVVRTIKDVSMLLTGVSATGSGIVNASEMVSDGFFVLPDPLASLSVSKQYGDGGVNIFDHAEFTPTPSILVRKDISLSGGALQGGSAHLSEFFQFYSQDIPEPVTLLTLTLGGAAMIFRRRKT